MGVTMAENRENFVRLAESRTEKTIRAIRILGNLSNPTNYSYTDKDVDEIFSSINKELKTAKSRFKQNPGSNGATSFKLSSNGD
jgi:hypothetical protein